MNDKEKKLRDDIRKTSDKGKFRDPFAYGVGYGQALTDIGEFLYQSRDLGIQIDGKVIAKLLIELNHKIGEEIKPLIK